jgi:predicted flap endonuclease-1-like 5' DNA nuclease
MSLLDKLKSLLGLGGSGSRSRDERDVGVTVERDGRRRRESERQQDRQRETDAESERAVKESPPPDGAGETAGDRESSAEPEASTTEASTESGAADADPATGGKAGEPETDDGGPRTDDGTEPEPATEQSDAASADGSDDGGTEDESRVPSEAVDVIKGIGPTYAERLSDAGVETVADLAAADPADLSERADVPEGRVENWVDQAEARDR